MKKELCLLSMVLSLTAGQTHADMFLPPYLQTGIVS